MGRKSRQEKEVRRLLALGRAVTATRDEKDPDGRPYAITASLQKVGEEYHFRMDHYYVTDGFGVTIREEADTFTELEQALQHLSGRSGIPLHEFKP